MPISQSGTWVFHYMPMNNISWSISDETQRRDWSCFKCWQFISWLMLSSSARQWEILTHGSHFNIISHCWIGVLLQCVQQIVLTPYILVPSRCLSVFLLGIWKWIEKQKKWWQEACCDVFLIFQNCCDKRKPTEVYFLAVAFLRQPEVADSTQFCGLLIVILLHVVSFLIYIFHFIQLLIYSHNIIGGSEILWISLLPFN